MDNHGIWRHWDLGPLLLHHWSLRMDKEFHPTLYNGCNYLTMLGFMLNHFNKGAPDDRLCMSVNGVIIVSGLGLAPGQSQTISWTDVDLSFEKASDIPRRSISQGIPQDINKKTLPENNLDLKFLSKSPRGLWVNSFWPSDTIRRQRSGSTLAQVMACCLMAPSHYLNQCWLIISEV